MNTLIETIQYFVLITIELVALFMLISALVEIILMYIPEEKIRQKLAKAGILGNVRFPTIIKVLIAQLVGRIAKSIAILFSICLLGNEVINVSVIWSTVLAGLPGMLLQLVIIPLLVFRVENRKQNNDKE